LLFERSFDYDPLAKFSKKIQHIELRTNQIVTGSTQTPFQIIGISRAVPDCNYFDFGMSFVDCKVDGIRPTLDSGLAAFVTRFGKAEWIGTIEAITASTSRTNRTPNPSAFRSYHVTASRNSDVASES
jgi:hypothetical protein